LINGIWEDAGNAGVSGTPGSDGWVSSNAAGGFSASSKSFALASAMGLENPLPLSSIILRAVRNSTTIRFFMDNGSDMDLKRIELQRSYDGVNYFTIYAGNGRNTFSYPVENRDAFYRLKAENSNWQ
jgi:hypothetical protein